MTSLFLLRCKPLRPDPATVLAAIGAFFLHHANSEGHTMTTVLTILVVVGVCIAGTMIALALLAMTEMDDE